MTTLAQARRNAARVLRADPEAARLRLRLPRAPRLLGNSVKIDKGTKVGVLTTVLYLAPATEAGFTNTCPWATAECAAACLGHSSGQMVFDSSRNARIWKTLLFKRHKREFFALLRAEVASHERKAKRKGYKCAVRLDGTSDLGLARALAPEFPAVQWYDYTKSAKRAVEAANGLPNWHVTFSYSGHNLEDCLRVLRLGGNVAVVFRTKDTAELPATWQGFPVLDADETDARFEDPPGHVAGLTFKGNKIEEAGAFAVPV